MRFMARCERGRMDSALLDIGTQCASPDCHTHDFLPLSCPACARPFCPAHILPDLHPCVAPAPPTTAQHDKLNRCALQHCSKLALDAYSTANSLACPACHNSYCPEHRHPTSHMCTPISSAPESVPNTKARALLAKVSSSAPRPSSKRVPKPPTDPVKLAAFQKVQRMKMRHTAVPLDPKDKSLSPPLDQRLHIKVRYGEISKVFWLRKTLITGKALDLICGHFGVGPSDSVPRRLSIDGSDAQLLNDKPLSEQADDGSTLSLLR